MSNIKAVIFDYGEVLCHRPHPEEFEYMAGVFGVSMEVFPELWLRHRYDFDRGDLTAHAYWSKFGHDTGRALTAEQIAELSNLDMQMWARDNAAMVEWMRALRAGGIKVGLLSNMHTDMVAHVREKFSWLNEFDFQTFSADVRMVKPDAAIYHYTLRGLNVKPEESIFIDDRMGNIDAAHALGMIGIQFRSIEQLREELTAMEFPILPSNDPVSAVAGREATS